MPNKPSKTRIIAVKLDGAAELHITQADQWEIHGGTPEEHVRQRSKIEAVIRLLAASGKTLETATIGEIEEAFSNLEKVASTP